MVGWMWKGLIALMVGLCVDGSTALALSRPTHWDLVLRAVSRIRESLEKIDLEETIPFERIQSISMDIDFIVSQPDETRLFVDHLIGAGKLEAGPFLRDWQVIAMKQASAAKRPEYLRILNQMGFPRLASAIGLSPEPGAGRAYLLQRIENERQRLELYQKPVGEVFDQQNQLKLGTRKLEHAAFFATLVLAVAVGDLAFYGAQYLDIRAGPVGHIAASIGLGVGVMSGMFNWVWPMLQEWFSKKFLRTKYADLVAAQIELLRSDPKTAIPQITAMAVPSGDVVTAQEDAALDALFEFDSAETTEALFGLGVNNLERGFVDRANKIFRRILERGPTTELGKLAKAVQDSIHSKKAFDKDLGKLKRKWIGRNVFRISIAIALSIVGFYLIEPDAITITRALIVQGIGFAGARALFERFWPRYPRAKLEEELAEARTRLKSSMTLLLETSVAQPPGRGLDMRKISVDVLMGLAKSKEAGESGELLRQAAREVLHQFDDDLALHFLALGAHEQILSGAIQSREPVREVREALHKHVSHAMRCLVELSSLSQAK